MEIYCDQLTEIRRVRQIWINIGIKHAFSYISVRQIPRLVLKTSDEAVRQVPRLVFKTSAEAEGQGFQHIPRDLTNVKALKRCV